MNTPNKKQLATQAFEELSAGKAFDKLSGGKPSVSAWIRAWKQVANTGEIDATEFNAAVFTQLGENARIQQETNDRQLANKEKFDNMFMDALTAARIPGFVRNDWDSVKLQSVYLVSSGEHKKHQIPSGNPFCQQT